MKNTIDRFEAGIVLLIYKAANFCLALLRNLLFFRNGVPTNVRNIIIFRKGNIGDIACAIPAMAAIRENFPQARITLLSTPGPKNAPGAKELLEKAPFLDELLVYYKGDAKDKKAFDLLVKALKAKKADLFIELPQNQESFWRLLRDIFFAKFIKARYAFGFEMGSTKIFGKAQSRFLNFDNEVMRLLKIISEAGLKVNEPVYPSIISEEDRESVRLLLKDMEISKLAAINFGAKRQTNLWPLERYVEIGKWLVTELGLSVALIGGEADKSRAEELKELIASPRVFVAAGKLTLPQTMELLRNCRLLISNDTGAVHLAAAVKTPVVGIYCAWQQKGKWYPFGERSIVLRKEPRCHTCFKNSCDHLTCLKMISVAEVKDAVKRLGCTA